MKTWNGRGIKTSLARGRSSSAPDSTDSVLRLGVAIPIVSRVLVGTRIRMRESAISKLGLRISKIVDKEKAKVEKVVAAAERTDIHSLVNRARSLRDKLEDAACAKLKFPEIDEEEGEARKPGRPKKAKPLNILCIKAIAKGIFDKDETTGMVKGKDASQTFKRDDLNVYLRKCVDQGGRVKITGAVVDSLTDGQKTGDVEIKVEAE